MAEVIVVIGPGLIGQAIARRVGVAKHIILADIRRENAEAAAEVMSNAGYDVSVATVDVSSRESVHALIENAAGRGDITGIIHAAGVSPSQASVATILKVDLYGTALVLEECGNVIAPGGSGVVIASQSGHRLPPLTVEQNRALATTPVEELLSLPFLQPDKVTDTLHAYQLSKRGNSLRVMAEAVRWGKLGERLGIFIFRRRTCRTFSITRFSEFSRCARFALADVFSSNASGLTHGWRAPAEELRNSAKIPIMPSIGAFDAGKRLMNASKALSEGQPADPQARASTRKFYSSQKLSGPMIPA